ncbi:zf-CCHC domain-containing protein/RVP_2 domain-containing protein [Cephalotus follicularis]|uniref:Zf-CCHC domain-containing protein/RVP_2 domain-containing protein n=1 Tax=Cephalotus follicularis TaxID=3775 RepID=A0A1Q3BG24_CEPFO|nr:zf-CCHC domain-containing protein/RVP_2 domain-containing protein [Cephalotus follicularis]
MELGTFVEVTQKARLLESVLNEDRVERARAQQSRQTQSQSRPASSKWQGSGSPTKSPRNRTQQTASHGAPSQGSDARTGVCYHCGRAGHQQKDCWLKKGLCLRCGIAGHSVRDCPRATVTAPTGPASGSASTAGPSQRRDTGKGVVKGRVFVLTQTEVLESTSIVGGTVYVYGFSARALMDSGASHSFIASRFASCLDVSPVCMPFVLDVSTPSGGSLCADSVYRGCELSVAGVLLSADLIVLPLFDFDVILGMDWL